MSIYNIFNWAIHANIFYLLGIIITITVIGWLLFNICEELVTDEPRGNLISKFIDDYFFTFIFIIIIILGTFGYTIFLIAK